MLLRLGAIWAATALSASLLSACGGGQEEQLLEAVVQDDGHGHAGHEHGDGDGHDHGGSTTSTPEGDGRYQAGIERLDTGVDLTKLATSGADHGADDGHGHGDGAHGSPAANALAQDDGGLTPSGHLSMVEGTADHDFGEMIQGVAGAHTFRMVSDGENDLVITRIKPSCGCTVAQVSLLTAEGKTPYVEGQPIPAGTEFEIETGLKSDGRQGAMKTQVSLYCNDPRSVFNLLLKAEVQPVLVLEPRTLNLGTTTSSAVVVGSMKLTSTTLQPFLLEADPQFNVKPLSLELTPVSPDGEGRATEWDVHVSVGPDIPEGMRNYPIRLVTDQPVPDPKSEAKDGSVKTYQVVGYAQVSVTGLVSAQPGFISFGMVRPGQVVERTIRIECHDDFKLSADMPIALVGLLKGENFPYEETFTHTLTSVEEGRLYDLVLRLEGLPDDTNGSFGGQVKVALGHPHKKQLVIRFSGVCRQGLPKGGTPAGGTPAPGGTGG